MNRHLSLPLGLFLLALFLPSSGAVAKPIGADAPCPNVPGGSNISYMTA